MCPLGISALYLYTLIDYEEQLYTTYINLPSTEKCTSIASAISETVSQQLTANN